MVANHSTVDKFLQVSLFGCLGGKGAVVIATDMDAGIVSRHLCGHERRWRISEASLGRLPGVSSDLLAMPYDIVHLHSVFCNAFGDTLRDTVGETSRGTCRGTLEEGTR